METSKEELRDWFESGIRDGKEFMIVVCDTFDWSNYPVYCSAAEFADKHQQHDGVNMQQIMEVYDLAMDCEEQISERRAFHYPPSFVR